MDENHIPYIYMTISTYPCPNRSWFMLVKGGLEYIVCINQDMQCVAGIIWPTKKLRRFETCLCQYRRWVGGRYHIRDAARFAVIKRADILSVWDLIKCSSIFIKIWRYDKLLVPMVQIVPSGSYHGPTSSVPTYVTLELYKSPDATATYIGLVNS